MFETLYLPLDQTLDWEVKEGWFWEYLICCQHSGSVFYSLELGITDVMISHIVMATSEFPHLPSLRLGSINLPQVCHGSPHVLNVLDNPELVILKDTRGGEFL